MRTLAAVALLALAGALALPATAQAQTCTLNTGDIWCGLMTVAEFTLNESSGTSRGFYTGGSGNLVPDGFSDDGTSYSVYGIYYVTEAVTGSFPAGTLVLTKWEPEATEWTDVSTRRRGVLHHERDD